MWVEDGVVMGIGLGVRTRERGRCKNMLIGSTVVYVHHSKHIRQGALQSYCVFLLEVQDKVVVGRWLGV